MDSQGITVLYVPQDALCKQAARSNLQSCNAVRLVTQFSRMSINSFAHEPFRKTEGIWRYEMCHHRDLPALPYKVVRSPTALLFHVCG